jgi:NTE family protein
MNSSAVRQKKVSAAIQKPLTGFVLSGGGARGAYQVGALKALCECGMQFDAISGVSIGALNGGVLACAPSLADGVMRLEALWRRLAKCPPLQLNKEGFQRLANPPQILIGLLQAILVGGRKNTPSTQRAKECMTENMKASHVDASLFYDAPLRSLMDEFLDMDRLEHGVPLFISACRSEEGPSGAWALLIGIALASVGGRNTSPPQFFHVQSLPRETRKEALLASAAIPMLFSPKAVDDGYYVDGGIGGWKNDEGNTPIQPLLEMGCRRIVVVNASDASPRNRHDFPGIDILEIRPRSTSRAKGLFGSFQNLLNFGEKTISKLMAQGYADAQRRLARRRKPVFGLE